MLEEYQLALFILSFCLLFAVTAVFIRKSRVKKIVSADKGIAEKAPDELDNKAPEVSKDLTVLDQALLTEEVLQKETLKSEVPKQESSQTITAQPPVQEQSLSWLQRLKHGLAKSRQHLSSSLLSILGSQTIDEKTIEAIFELLYRADIGASTVEKLTVHLNAQFKTWDPKTITHTKLLQALYEKSLEIMHDQSPQAGIAKEAGNPEYPMVMLMVGVNGVGKTTTTAKLANLFKSSGKKVLLCAADTYRAAAIDQLKIWGERLDIKVVAHTQGSDPAAVAYDAAQSARSKDYDVLIVDTAGRLHNKSHLMEELAKIKRSILKELPKARLEVILVLDATTGQNAFQQTQAFKEAVDISSLLITKLDGTAKGGVVIGLKDKFGIPIHYIGIGEKPDDLKEFNAEEFLGSLFLEA